MISNDAHDSQPTPRRLTLKSARGALAVSAVALSVLGLSQVSGTSAAWQDTNSSATSGSLTIAADVVPPVASVSCETVGQGSGSQDARLKWNHLGPAYRYRVDIYKSGTSSRYTYWNKDPDASFPAGSQITSDITSDDTTYEWTNRDYTAQVFTINRHTGEESTSWRGHNARRGSATWNVWCIGSPISSAAAMMTMPEGGTPEAVALEPESSPTSTPSPAPVETTTATSVPPTTQPSPTTTTSPSTTTSPTSTTMTTTSASAPAVSDTPLSAATTSTSDAYSALLVTSSATSRTAIVISDANGEEVKRLSVTSAAQYEWDPSMDTLWIVDEGQLYKASGSDWTKTVVDPSSDDVPADIAALLE